MFRPWLPVEAATGTRFRAELSRVVALWSNKWCGSAPMVVFPAISVTIGDRIDEAAAGQSGGDLHVVVKPAPEGRGRLAERLLNIDLNRFPPNAIDATVIQLLIDEAIKDLSDLTTQFLVPGGNEGRPIGVESNQQYRTFAIGLSAAAPILHVTMRIADIVRVLRSAASPDRHSDHSRFQARTETLKSVTVPIEAQLGRIRLSLAELDSLAVGDVLILSGHSGREAQIGVSGSASSFASGELAPAGGSLALIVTESAGINP